MFSPVSARSEHCSAILITDLCAPVAELDAQFLRNLHPFAGLSTNISIDNLGGRHVERFTPQPQARIASWQALADACNRYYLPRLRREIDLIDSRRLAAPDWLHAMRKLLTDLQPALARGDAALLRVGRHSGAENMTLDGARNGSIKIMRLGGRTTYEDEATTIWMAAEHDGHRSDMQPFGWLVMHRPQAELPALEAWCAAQPCIDMTAIMLKLAQAQAQARARAEELKAEQARRLLADAQAQEAAEQERLRLAALSPQGQEVEALRKQLLAHTAARKQPIGGHLYQLLRSTLANAEQGGWSGPDRAALAELLRTLVPQKIDLGSKAKDIKQAANRLTGET